MRRASLCLLTGLSLTFAINCGSGTSDGSGSGGSGGQASGGTTGKGGGGAGTNDTGGAAGGHSTGGGTGGDHAAAGAGGASATGGAGGDHSTGGAGGASATGGAGGDHSTGGAGGASATGGAGGGGTGSGGHAGAGGGTGTGGGAGAGGHPTGGQGGQAVDSGVTCAELASEYGAALPEAEACTPGAASQCQQLVSTSLGACSCQRYVEDATTLNAIRAQWTSQGCAPPVNAAVIICTIACVNPGTAGSCVATDAAAPGGVCAGIFTPAL